MMPNQGSLEASMMFGFCDINSVELVMIPLLDLQKLIQPQ